MNTPDSNRIIITLTSAYGIIYGGIALILLATMLIAPKEMVFRDSYQTAPLPLLKQPVTLNLFTCTFKKITGIPCVTCGGTRATFHLSHLRLKQSFLMNPMVFLGFIGLLAWGIISLVSIAAGKAKTISLPLPGKRLLAILIIGGVLVNWAYLIFICQP